MPPSPQVSIRGSFLRAAEAIRGHSAVPPSVHSCPARLIRRRRVSELGRDAVRNHEKTGLPPVGTTRSGPVDSRTNTRTNSPPKTEGPSSERHAWGNEMNRLAHEGRPGRKWQLTVHGFGVPPSGAGGLCLRSSRLRGGHHTSVSAHKADLVLTTLSTTATSGGPNHEMAVW